MSSGVVKLPETIKTVIFLLLISGHLIKEVGTPGPNNSPLPKFPPLDLAKLVGLYPQNHQNHQISQCQNHYAPSLDMKIKLLSSSSLEQIYPLLLDPEASVLFQVLAAIIDVYVTNIDKQALGIYTVPG